MDRPELSLVVPIYNEGEGVVPCLQAIRGVADGLGLRYELILIDDGSTDPTWEALTRFALAAPNTVLLRLSRNFGKEAAICCGLDACRGDAVVVMDADLQHPPELLPQMVALWRQGFAVVEAVKSRRAKEPLVDRLGSLLFYRLLAALTGVRLAGASDFKLLARPVLERWRELGESETFFRGLVPWLGFRRAEVSFAVPERQDGSSRWSTWQRFRLALLAITSFSSLPLQFITMAGILLFLLAAGLAVQALVLKWQGLAVPGFTTVIILLGVIGSTIMISLGIIGLYIARIYNEVKRRPRYVVATRSGDAVGPH